MKTSNRDGRYEREPFLWLMKAEQRESDFDFQTDMSGRQNTERLHAKAETNSQLFDE